MPKPTPETAPYWDAAKAGELRVQKCGGCGRHYFYPRPFCRSCASPDVGWVTVSGRARLVSYVINRRSMPGFESVSPVIALVELDEGPRLMTNVVGVLPDTSMLQLHAEAWLNALRDAGLAPADVDGVATAAERAADLPSGSRAVCLLGSGEATESAMVSQMEDPGSFQAFRRSSAETSRTAGLGHGDVDHLMIYDAFAHLPLYGLEDLGFVGRGESGAFIADGHTIPGGSLPVNTDGGGLAYTHTGMYGMFAILESVRQLRGEAAAQVAGVEVSFVQGVGIFFAASGSLVLSNRGS